MHESVREWEDSGGCSADACDKTLQYAGGQQLGEELDGDKDGRTER